MINLTKEQEQIRLEFMVDMKYRRKMNNAKIGRLFCISRERVRQIFNEKKNEVIHLTQKYG